MLPSHHQTSDIDICIFSVVSMPSRYLTEAVKSGGRYPHSAFCIFYGVHIRWQPGLSFAVTGPSIFSGPSI